MLRLLTRLSSSPISLPSPSFLSSAAMPPNLLMPSQLLEASRPQRPPPPADCALPVLRRCQASVPSHLQPVRAWVETLQHQDGEATGLAELHPDVFAVPPRLDILHQVEVWQRNYKRISHAHTKVRSEVRGGGRKPWRQKGGGRARHGSIRSPLWRGGGVSHGPRGPTSYYYMLPMRVRGFGLRVALSSKRAQECLHIVDSVDVPTSDPQYLLDLLSQRHWGESVMIVDVGEEFPVNLLEATARLKTVNLVPAIGLNVHSLLKHEAVLLTLAAVGFLEEKLLWLDRRSSPLYPFSLPYSDRP